MKNEIRKKKKSQILFLHTRLTGNDFFSLGWSQCPYCSVWLRSHLLRNICLPGHITTQPIRICFPNFSFGTLHYLKTLRRKSQQHLLIIQLSSHAAGGGNMRVGRRMQHVLFRTLITDMMTSVMIISSSWLTFSLSTLTNVNIESTRQLVLLIQVCTSPQGG